MKVNLRLYPTLTEDLYHKSNIGLSTPVFSYTNMRDGKIKTISYREDNGTIILDDNGGIWNISYDDLIVSQELRLGNPSVLFGDEGIAPLGSRIGIGLKWFSRSSRQRSAIKVGFFDEYSKGEVFSLDFKFDRKQLSKSVNYEIILYVDDISNSDNSFLANEYGLELGKVYTNEILLEGDTSTFQIISIESKDSPLWSLECNWNDILDRYDETVMLKINKEHRDYDLLNTDSNKYNVKLFEQILTNVVAIIIQTAVSRNEIELITEDAEFPIGTIGNLIKYYLDIYEVKYDSPSSIFDSITKHLWR